MRLQISLKKISIEKEYIHTCIKIATFLRAKMIVEIVHVIMLCKNRQHAKCVEIEKNISFKIGCKKKKPINIFTAQSPPLPP